MIFGLYMLLYFIEGVSPKDFWFHFQLLDTLSIRMTRKLGIFTRLGVLKSSVFNM